MPTNKSAKTKQDDPFAPLPKKRVRRTRAQMAQDALDDAALVRSQAVAPNALAMRHDKPTAPMSVAYSPMLVPLADDVPIHLMAIARGAGVEMDGVESLAELFRGICRLSKHAPERAATFLFAVATGAKHRDAFAAAGLTMVDISVFKQADQSFAKTYDLCKRLQADFMAMEVLDAARARSVDGVVEPIVGRVGKDEDGQLLDRAGNPMTRVRYSDKLAEVILRATDKRFRDDHGGVATGTGTTYNIQINNNAPDAPDAPETGGKWAENTGEPSKIGDIADIFDE